MQPKWGQTGHTKMSGIPGSRNCRRHRGRHIAFACLAVNAGLRGHRPLASRNSARLLIPAWAAGGAGGAGRDRRDRGASGAPPGTRRTHHQAREQVPLRGRVAGQAADQPAVQRPLSFTVVGDLLRVLPPCLQVAPPEAAVIDVPVVDQDLAGVRDDLDVVVDGVAEADVGLDGRGEDEVLRLAGPPRPG